MSRLTRNKQNFLTSVLLTALVLTGPSVWSETQPKASLVFLDGHVVTLDENVPLAEAVAVHGDTIMSVGSDETIRALIGDNTKVIDLKGRLLIPGFIDSHAHFMSLGKSLMRLRLGTAHNYDEIVAMVKEAVSNAQPGEWILGRGWHQEKWDRAPEPNVDGLPTHRELSEISPDNPVMLTHASGHAILVNDRAMQLARITRDTPDPEGGEIVRDADGNPIGVFRENAEDLITIVYDQYQPARTTVQIRADELEAIELATHECLSKGITTFCDAATPLDAVDIYRELADQGKLGLRLWVMVCDSNHILERRLPDYHLIGYGNNFLTVRAIKRVFDGALGSHGAWLLEPYDDLPNSTGLNTETIPYMKETAQIALANGFQFCTHAIGDRANREVLNIYEEALKSHPQGEDLRWRIEHAQHLNPDDIPRFQQLGVIASMQGVHCTSDGPWVPKRIGNQRASEGAYVWRKLLQSGAVVVNGTDAPVEDVDPIACFYASVTRRLPDGTQFFPDQCMTREEALRSYTLGGAYAMFEENLKGSITPGKLADLVVLSHDIMTIPEEDIPATKVAYTIVGGKIAYER
jgi:predicted amidohydrolase YtcJ